MEDTGTRNPYPSDISDDDLREVLNGLRWIVRTGSPWRYMPHDLPPWHTVYQQAQRWFRAGCFEAIVADLRAVIRLGEGKSVDPTAAIFDSRTVPGSVENGDRGGDDGHKRTKGTKLHRAVDTLGEFLALVVTAADAQDRAQVEELAAAVDLADVDQGYTGQEPEAAADGWGIRLEVVKLPEARKGFVLLPRRWVVEPLVRLVESLSATRQGL